MGQDAERIHFNAAGKAGRAIFCAGGSSATNSAANGMADAPERTKSEVLPRSMPSSARSRSFDGRDGKSAETNFAAGLRPIGIVAIAGGLIQNNVEGIETPVKRIARRMIEFSRAGTIDFLGNGPGLADIAARPGPAHKRRKSGK